MKPMFATSASTLAHPFDNEDAGEEFGIGTDRGWRSPTLGAFVFATMLPFASIYEPVRGRLRNEAATLGAYVIVIGHEEEMLHSPGVIAIDPKRPTFRIGAAPRLLARRGPFIGPLDLISSD